MDCLPIGLPNNWFQKLLVLLFCHITGEKPPCDVAKVLPKKRGLRAANSPIPCLILGEVVGELYRAFNSADKFPLFNAFCALQLAGPPIDSPVALKAVIQLIGFAGFSACGTLTFALPTFVNKVAILPSLFKPVAVKNLLI